MGKSICEKHQRAFETECPYCEPAKPSEATDAYADIVKSYYNPRASQVPSTTSAPEIEAAMNDAWAMLAAKDPADATPPPARSSFSIAEEVVREVAKESGVGMHLQPSIHADSLQIWASMNGPTSVVHALATISNLAIAARANDEQKLRAFIRTEAELCIRSLRKAAIPFHPEG